MSLLVDIRKQLGQFRLDVSFETGGGVLGIGGMLLAVPLAAALYQMLRDDVARRN